MKRERLKPAARRYYRSSSFKMAMLFTLFLGITVIFIGYSGYYFSRDYFIKTAENIINTEIRYLVNADQKHDLDRTLRNVEQNKDRIYLLKDQSGHKLQGNIDTAPEGISEFSKETLIVPYQARKFALMTYDFKDGRKLIVGTDVTSSLKISNIMQWAGILVIVLTISVIFTSFLISTFVVSRTNMIAQTAKEIMDTGDLSQRIKMDSRWDDLGNMAYVLNSLFDRIEQLLGGIRHVSDNIAHDLRTPLARLRNSLEIQQKKSGDPVYGSLIGEADGLLNIFNALLRIARIEAGKQRSQFKDIDFHDLITDVIEFYEPLAEEKNIKIEKTIDGSIKYRGDRDLLFQALTNLLDNAIKFTPYSGTVSVFLHAGPVLTIQDSGPGVDESEQKKIFDRFYRTEASRTTQGSGLGLSMVAAVVELHNGKIKVTNAHPGLKIVLML